MSVILEFARAATPSAGRPPLRASPGGAEVVVFPGVRVERVDVGTPDHCGGSGPARAGSSKDGAD